MRLHISRTAAPTSSLTKLAALVRARGFDGVELVAGDLTEMGPAGAPAEPGGAELSISGVYVTSVEAASSEALVKAAAAAKAPVVAARGVVPAGAISELDALYGRAGARLYVMHGTDAEEAAALAEAVASAGARHVSTAWELDPAAEDLADAPAVLLVAGETLGYVRLRGGGPELREQDGSGVGGVFASLALARYTGPITLAPSREDRAPEWEKWLERTGKSGCGSRTDAGDVALDMRAVEPRDRLDTILGAYRTLAAGRTLHLTLDHDPQCMYFTLEATEPQGSFTFERVENGPEVWRVDVGKRALQGQRAS